MDLQLNPRDDEPTTCQTLGWFTAPVKVVSPFSSSHDGESLEERIDLLLSHLSMLSLLVETKNAFSSGGNADIEFSAGIVRGCTEEYDPELLRCQFIDWFTVVERQHVLQKESITLSTSSGDSLAEEIRLTELNVSVAGANKDSLKLVKERLSGISEDRSNRLSICKEMIEEVCLREMNLFVSLSGPTTNHPLDLKKTTA